MQVMQPSVFTFLLVGFCKDCNTFNKSSFSTHRCQNNNKTDQIMFIRKSVGVYKGVLAFKKFYINGIDLGIPQIVPCSLRIVRLKCCDKIIVKHEDLLEKTFLTVDT